jgi:hypothetical protein
MYSTCDSTHPYGLTLANIVRVSAAILVMFLVSSLDEASCEWWIGYWPYCIVCCSFNCGSDASSMSGKAPNSRVHKCYKILSTTLGAGRVLWSKFHTEDPQILGSTVQNLVARVTSAQDLCTPALSISSCVPLCSLGLMPRCEVQFHWSATLVSMEEKVLQFTVACRSVNFSFSVVYVLFERPCLQRGGETSHRTGRIFLRLPYLKC